MFPELLHLWHKTSHKLDELIKPIPYLLVSSTAEELDYIINASVVSTPGGAIVSVLLSISCVVVMFTSVPLAGDNMLTRASNRNCWEVRFGHVLGL